MKKTVFGEKKRLAHTRGVCAGAFLMPKITFCWTLFFAQNTATWYAPVHLPRRIKNYKKTAKVNPDPRI